jgi:hypothetical protein
MKCLCGNILKWVVKDKWICDVCNREYTTEELNKKEKRVQDDA